MFKKVILFSCLLISVSSVIAQYPKRKPGKIWYKPVKIETPILTVESNDFVSVKEYSKFKLIVTNKSQNFLLIKPTESYFNVGSIEVPPIDKRTIKILPATKEARVLDAKSFGSNSLYEYSLGFTLFGIYKSSEPIIVMPPEFKLPPSQNVIEIDGFRIELTQHDINKDIFCYSRFKVTYTGDGIGIVDSRKISARTASGEILANALGEKIFVLEKGESEHFSNTFKVNAPVTILWNDAFKRASLEKIDNVSLDIQYDPFKK